MKTTSPSDIEGRLVHLIYSPRGEIEGALLETAQGSVQLVFDRHDEAASALFLDMDEGQAVAVEARPLPPSPKGQAEHMVCEFQALKTASSASPGYRGRVVRFNYARHGEINGVVLDSGDFLHFKPQGYAKLALKVGDEVEAEGDAHRLADGRGWAVEAVRVNGRPFSHH